MVKQLQCTCAYYVTSSLCFLELSFYVKKGSRLSLFPELFITVIFHLYFASSSCFSGFHASSSADSCTNQITALEKVFSH